MWILHLAPQIWPHSSCCRSKPSGDRLKSQSAGGAVLGSWASSHCIPANWGVVALIFSVFQELSCFYSPSQHQNPHESWPQNYQFEHGEGKKVSIKEYLHLSTAHSGGWVTWAPHIVPEASGSSRGHFSVAKRSSWSWETWVAMQGLLLSAKPEVRAILPDLYLFGCHGA